MPLYYHGTVKSGLRVLRPFASPHSNVKEATVYLSASKALSAVYIWNKEYKWMTFSIRDDGLPVYTESFRGALRELYGGVAGYIYTCEGNYSTQNDTGIKLAAVSFEPVPVVDCEPVADAYERILDFEREGALLIRRFDDLTDQEQTANTVMVKGAIRRLNLLDGTHVLSAFVAERFPELWEEAGLNVEEKDGNPDHP